jgi:hypothetical protein
MENEGLYLFYLALFRDQIRGLVPEVELAIAGYTPTTGQTGA